MSLRVQTVLASFRDPNSTDPNTKTLNIQISAFSSFGEAFFLELQRYS